MSTATPPGASGSETSHASSRIRPAPSHRRICRSNPCRDGRPGAPAGPSRVDVGDVAVVVPQDQAAPRATVPGRRDRLLHDGALGAGGAGEVGGRRPQSRDEQLRRVLLVHGAFCCRVALRAGPPLLRRRARRGPSRRRRASSTASSTADSVGGAESFAAAASARATSAAISDSCSWSVSSAGSSSAVSAAGSSSAGAVASAVSSSAAGSAVVRGWLCAASSASISSAAIWRVSITWVSADSAAVGSGVVAGPAAAGSAGLAGLAGWRLGGLGDLGRLGCRHDRLRADGLAGDPRVGGGSAGALDGELPGGRPLTGRPGYGGQAAPSGGVHRLHGPVSVVGGPVRSGFKHPRRAEEGTGVSGGTSRRVRRRPRGLRRAPGSRQPASRPAPPAVPCGPGAPAGTARADRGRS